MNWITFNQLSKDELHEQLKACCGASKWIEVMMDGFPFDDEKQLLHAAQNTWYHQCLAEDWLAAFTHHPAIGDIKTLAEKFASTQKLAANEQAAVNDAPDSILQALADANTAYYQKFGFIFIVCATGKSASEMLRLMNDRLINSYEEELAIAMGEQYKITVIRLKKLLDETDWSFLKQSQITTHVLDTSIGKPCKDITIQLKRLSDNNWITIAQGVTNTDGRIADLLPPGRILLPGNYCLVFYTKAYFDTQGIMGFYPEVAIQFSLFDDTHYHVPLLINPFGYSTYRGS